jgi:hypothetical protein
VPVIGRVVLDALPAGELRRRSDIVRRLLLAVEAISPSSERHDHVTKRPRYQRNRVPDYWIVDDTSQTIERWRPDDERPELLAEQLVWHPIGAAEPFVLDLVRFSPTSRLKRKRPSTALSFRTRVPAERAGGTFIIR